MISRNLYGWFDTLFVLVIGFYLCIFYGNKVWYHIVLSEKDRQKVKEEKEKALKEYEKKQKENERKFKFNSILLDNDLDLENTYYTLEGYMNGDLVLTNTYTTGKYILLKNEIKDARLDFSNSYMPNDIQFNPVSALVGQLLLGPVGAAAYGFKKSDLLIERHALTILYKNHHLIFSHETSSNISKPQPSDFRPYDPIESGVKKLLQQYQNIERVEAERIAREKKIEESKRTRIL